MAHVVLTYPLLDGSAAKGSEVKADLDLIVAQVNGNLDDSNIKVGAAIDANKLSNLAGARVAEDRIEDDAVTAVKLKDDPAGLIGAVTTDHIRNANVTLAKMATNSVDSTKLTALSVLSGKVKTGFIDWAPGGTLVAGNTINAAALLPANGVPLFIEIRGGGAPGAVRYPIVNIYFDTAGNQYYISLSNHGNTAPAENISLVGLTFRMVYIAAA